MSTETIDPLSELQGPALFPRTVIASAGEQVSVDSKDLDSIHQFMKSLREIQSPGKLLNEAKRIVNEGSDLISVVGVVDAGAVKFKDKPQERRPGLSLARSRAPFSMKAEVRQPDVREQKMDIDLLHDPDEFFDAYERMEYARKEIHKQVGGDFDVLYRQRPSLARRHRPGLLGKSYNSKNRYSAYFSQNDDVLAPSPVGGEQANPNSSKDDRPENLDTTDFILAMDFGDTKVTGNVTENEVCDILGELLSCNDEDLDGDGALNLLQEKLNIKPLDLESLTIPEHSSFGKNGTSSMDRLPESDKSLTIPEHNSFGKNGTSSMDHLPESDKIAASADKVMRLLESDKVSTSTDKVLAAKRGMSSPLGSKLLSQRRIPLSTSPTLKSPFSSIASLLKRSQKQSSQKDPFSPGVVDLFSSQSDPSLQSMDELQEQDLVPKNLLLTILDKYSEVGAPENASQILGEEMAVGGHDVSSQVDGKRGLQVEKCRDEPNKKLVINSEALNGNDTSHERASVTDNQDASALKNATIQDTPAGSGKQARQGESRTLERAREPNRISEARPMGKGLAGGTDNQNASVPQDHMMDGTFEEDHTDSEKQVRKRKLVSSKGAGGAKRTTKAHPVRRSLAGEVDNPNPGALAEVAASLENHVGSPKKVNQEKLHASKGAAAAIQRIAKAHPMRKSIADRGTSFENGVRRSKRIRTRPLEYWRGERLLYGRVQDSLKLIGVRCLSPANGNNVLKVKPYIPSESAEMRELLDWAARC